MASIFFFLALYCLVNALGGTGVLGFVWLCLGVACAFFYDFLSYGPEPEKRESAVHVSIDGREIAQLVARHVVGAGDGRPGAGSGGGGAR